MPNSETLAALKVPLRLDFDSFNSHHCRSMVRLAFVLVDTNEAAEEVVHDGFVAVLARSAWLDNPTAYLRRCVLNRARQILRLGRIVRRQQEIRCRDAELGFNHLVDATMAKRRPPPTPSPSETAVTEPEPPGRFLPATTTKSFGVRSQGAFPQCGSSIPSKEPPSWTRTFLISSPATSTALGEISSGLVRFFRWLTGRSGSVRNVRHYAEATELAQDTVHAYLGELAEVHLVESIRWFRPGHDHRETQRERIFVADPSFVAAALPVDTALLMQNSDAFGRLLETFVFTELTRTLG